MGVVVTAGGQEESDWAEEIEYEFRACAMPPTTRSPVPVDDVSPAPPVVPAS